MAFACFFAARFVKSLCLRLASFLTFLAFLALSLSAGILAMTAFLRASRLRHWASLVRWGHFKVGTNLLGLGDYSDLAERLLVGAPHRAALVVLIWLVQTMLDALANCDALPVLISYHINASRVDETIVLGAVDLLKVKRLPGEGPAVRPLHHQGMVVLDNRPHEGLAYLSHLG